MLASQNISGNNIFSILLLQVSSDNVVLTQVVKPHRDFLSGNFLLSLQNTIQPYPGSSVSVGGQWQVTLEACVIDQNGIVWATGPKR